MQDISLHLLDIIENSMRAEASRLALYIEINKMENRLKIVVTDNGHGMDQEMLINSQDPFFTTKTERTKKVGLGIPLFKQNAELCAGNFSITSEKGKGTRIIAEFRLDHIDRMPLGSISDTILTSIIGHPDVDIILDMKRVDEKNEETSFIFNTQEIKKELEGIPLNHPEVTGFITEYLSEGINNIYREEI